MHDPKTETKNYLKGDRSAFQSSTDKCFKNKTSNLMRIFSLISFQRLLTINTQHKIKNSFNLFSSSFFGKALVYSAARIESRTCVKWNYWKSQSQKKRNSFFLSRRTPRRKEVSKAFLRLPLFAFRSWVYSSTTQKTQFCISNCWFTSLFSLRLVGWHFCRTRRLTSLLDRTSRNAFMTN